MGLVRGLCSAQRGHDGRHAVRAELRAPAGGLGPPQLRGHGAAGCLRVALLRPGAVGALGGGGRVHRGGHGAGHRGGRSGRAAQARCASQARLTPAARDTDACVPAYPWAVRCWAAVVAYEGTDFAGFQLQLQAGDPRARTVQGALEAAVERVTGQPRAAQSMIAAGRTDRGVHARGQLVSFLTGVRGRGGAPLDPDRLARALNGVLPPDVRVARVIAVPPDFSAHYACLSKIYEYDLATGPYVDPFARRTCAAFPGPFDVDRAREACRALEGAHDFTQLSTRAADGAERDPRRMVLSCTVQALAGGHGCRIRVQGAGFLYRQVRHMVGAVAAVARGRCSLAALQERLAVGGRVPRGELPPLWAVAPPQGLTLSAVEVPDPLPLPEDLMFPGLPHAESGLVDGAAVLAMDGTHLEDAIGAYLGRTGSGTLLTGVYSDSLHPLPSEVA